MYAPISKTIEGFNSQHLRLTATICTMSCMQRIVGGNLTANHFCSNGVSAWLRDNSVSFKAK